jgi:hypothetical protein
MEGKTAEVFIGRKRRPLAAPELTDGRGPHESERNDIQFLASGLRPLFGCFGAAIFGGASICGVSGRFLSNFSLNGEPGAAHGRDKSNRVAWAGVPGAVNQRVQSTNGRIKGHFRPIRPEEIIVDLGPIDCVFDIKERQQDETKTADKYGHRSDSLLDSAKWKSCTSRGA